MMKMLIVLLSFLSITSIIIAQERMILRSNGEQIKLNHKKDLREAITETKLTNLSGKIAQSVFSELQNSEESIDTIGYRGAGGSFNTNFGFNGQDVMFMWFEAETDMTIKGIGFSCSDDEGYRTDGATVGLRLIKLNWTKEELTNFGLATHQGYYPSDSDGFNNSDYFGENSTGNWISKDENNLVPPWSNNENPDSNSFNYNLWPDNGFFFPVVPVAEISWPQQYNWLDISATGLSEPSVKSGDVFAVVAKNYGVNLDSSRIGFWSDSSIGIPSWKYYENGHLANNEPGWWVRMYTLDFVVAVEFPDCPRNLVSDITNLRTTLSTEPRRVEAIVSDDNPSGESNIAEVNLVYVTAGIENNYIVMTKEGDTYSADIPGQAPGTEVKYWITVEETDGNMFVSLQTFIYSIFKVENNNALLVFNGFSDPIGFPQSYYFGASDFDTYSTLEWDHDSWAYGALTEELVNNYRNIIEITTNGPSDINSDVIKAWLAGDATRNYMLAGDEWLGAQSGWTNQAHEASSFQYDVLGISFEYNNINYAEAGDQSIATEVNAIEGSLLGGKLFDLHQQISADSGWTSSILYDPTYEVGLDNWIDGVEFLEDVEVDMTGLGIDSVTYNIAGHRVLPAGNKIVFLAYDPLSLHAHNNNGAVYYWYGFAQEAPQVQALHWFNDNCGLIISVNDDENIINSSLSQNYPNPFNPSTTIKYSIPNKAVIASGAKQSNKIATSSAETWTPRNDNMNVKLKVYDILGREVTTLVNENQKPGNYEVKFDASILASGIYFYKIQSGSFVKSRKMILLR